MRAMENSIDDRLSNLPDSILYHILKFVESVEAVRTSVLSRRWRCVWKHVPSLHLSDYSFGENYLLFLSSFKVLSCRYRVNIDKFRYLNFDDEDEPELCQRVIQYAFTHNVQHIDINLEPYVKFSELFGSVSNCCLKSLVLSGVSFDVGSSCFQMLTTLDMDCCRLLQDHLDLSVNFPCLVNFEMAPCSQTGIKVYAPQLLNMKLYGYHDYSIEIVAPKLEFFSIVSWVTDDDFLGTPSFTLPYVDHGEVSMKNNLIKLKKVNLSEEMQVSRLDSMCTGLQNARSVMLRCYTIEELDAICKFLERKPFNFTKLESLVCISDESLKVVKYAVEGSSGEDPNMKRFRRM
ncbi:F-box/LRR-repeat protein 13 [Linum perenne]